MEKKFDDFETEPSKRPAFLTVLCILTFIGSSWAILSAVWSYATADQTVKIFNEKRREQALDSISKKDSVHLQNRKEGKGFVIGKMIGASLRSMLTVDKIQKKSIGDLIAAILTLSGGILMWFQKRRGFYLYIIGVAIGIALPFYLYGNDFLAVGMASFGSFFGLLFIALYAVNLKSLNK